MQSASLYVFLDSYLGLVEMRLVEQFISALHVKSQGAHFEKHCVPDYKSSGIEFVNIYSD
jgi:hypothetical protein